MGTINKQSVREEVDRINTEFERLSTDKKMAPEVKVFVKSILILINLLVSIFLEKTTKKTPKNSSRPPSQTEKDDSALSSIGSKAKGKRELNLTADNTRTIETITTIGVEDCDVCGTDLTKIPCLEYERRTKIDIIFEKTVEHIDAEIKQCPECDTIIKGQFSSDMPGPLQYGNGLKAYVVSLLICQMISLDRCQKMIKSMLGEVIAQATFLTFYFAPLYGFRAMGNHIHRENTQKQGDACG